MEYEVACKMYPQTYTQLTVIMNHIRVESRANKDHLAFSHFPSIVS